ncbi:hypothetical protein M9H77_17486 [Catharanthus roseus]|uniref:Uncharacterized protein n=1 Tax=Catharanthus roseus TaxID=4058 RepID=A0ACC0B4S8_CATRO|nr:hypothetical protein M9H77_17486 [Catharanthus roseus]
MKAHSSSGKVPDRMKNMWYTEFEAKYQDLKANVERLHIETGSPILTDEQFMFEAASRRNKGCIYGFGSQSVVVTAECWGGNSSFMYSVPSVSSAASHEACIERERRL